MHVQVLCYHLPRFILQLLQYNFEYLNFTIFKWISAHDIVHVFLEAQPEACTVKIIMVLWK